MAKDTRSPIDLRTSANLRELSTTTIEQMKVVLLEYIAHANVTNPAAHTIDNIDGLQAALDLKQDAAGGATGSVTVITSVDFVGQTVSTKTISYSNGIITGVV